MGRTSCRIVAALLLVFTAVCSSRDPGMKIRITRRGMEYANEVARDILREKIRWLRIPNQRHSRGKFSTGVHNIRVTGVDHPSSRIRFNQGSNGLQWAIENFGISVTANYWAEFEVASWWKIGNSGWFKASVVGANVWETLAFGRDYYSGRPTISHSGCWNSIRDVNIRFYGRLSWLINLFRRSIGKDIKNMLKSRICSQAAKVINENAQQALSEMRMTSDLAGSFYLDNSLVASPKVTSEYLEVYNKGTVYHKYGKVEPPISPEPLPQSSYGNKHVYFWLSEYSFNTLLYQAQRKGQLKTLVTKHDLPRKDQHLVDTICLPGMCVGSVIPQVGQDYPDSTMEVSMESPARPEVSFTPDKLTVDVSTLVGVQVRTSGNNVTKLASANVQVTLGCTANVRGHNITARIVSHSLKVSNLRVFNYEINTTSEMNDIFTEIFGDAVVPMINVLAEQGLELPVTGGVKFVNPYVSIKQGFLVIGTDVRRTP